MILGKYFSVLNFSFLFSKSSCTVKRIRKSDMLKCLEKYEVHNIHSVKGVIIVLSFLFLSHFSVTLPLVSVLRRKMIFT